MSELFLWHFSPICMSANTHRLWAWAKDFISQGAAQDWRWGCCTLLNCCPGRSLLTVMSEGQRGPLGPMTNRAAVLRCVSGVFFHKAFYKSVTAPSLPFLPCTHALLSQQAPKELLRSAEPTHKLALLATPVILSLFLLNLFLASVVDRAESCHGARWRSERRCLFGAWS